MKHVDKFRSCFIAGLMLIASVALADNITFKVNMKVMRELGFFDPATQTLHVRGSFNSWGDGSDLSDADADLIYEGQINVGTGASIAYKFVVKTAGNVTWEDNISDRQLPLTGSDQVLAPVEWNNGVKLRVSMSVPITTAVFDPATQFVSVAGGFNDWLGTGSGITDGDSATARKFQLTDSNNDQIYEANVPIGTSSVQYKFTINRNSTGKVASWENDPNRTIDPVGMTLGAPTQKDELWNRDAGGLFKTGTMLFQVDITPLKELGLFDETEGDTLQLRGEFNGWNAADPAVSIMRQSFLDPNIYELPITVTKVVGAKLPYKFFIDYNPTRAIWGGSAPISGWEEPGSTGGGNREAVFSGDAQQLLSIQTFNDIFNVIPEDTTVTMNFTADMRCFLRNPPVPVDKSQDTLRLDVQDEVWHFFNNTLSYNGSSNLIGKGPTPFDFSDADGDSVYHLALTVKGPLQNWVQYHLNWQGYDDRAPGFDAGRRRVRYTRPDASTGRYARSYQMGLDYISTEIKPLVVEDPGGAAVNDTPPCDLVTSVEQTDGNVPGEYKLGQNYPNPFNPSTTFEYNVRKSGLVTISLYNYLGQKIADLVNETQAAGTYKITVDLSSLQAFGRASGVYFYKMTAGDFQATHRMMFVK